MVLKSHDVVFFSAECIICYVGAIANGLVLFLLLQHKSLQTRANIYIGFLTFACSLGGVIVPICHIFNTFRLSVDFHTCLVFQIIPYIFTIATLLSLVFLELDRFLSVTNLRYGVMSRNKGIKYEMPIVLFVTSWVFSIIIGLIAILGWHKSESEYDNICSFSKTVDLRFVVYLCFFGLFVPVHLLMTFMSFIVLRTFRKSSETQKHRYSLTISLEREEREKRIPKALLFIYLLTLISYLPINIVDCILLWYPSIPIPRPLISSCTLLFYSIFVSFPWIYAVWQDNFRIALKLLLRYRFPRCYKSVRSLKKKISKTKSKDKLELKRRVSYKFTPEHMPKLSPITSCNSVLSTTEDAETLTTALAGLQSEARSSFQHSCSRSHAYVDIIALPGISSSLDPHSTLSPTRHRTCNFFRQTQASQSQSQEDDAAGDDSVGNKVVGDDVASYDVIGGEVIEVTGVLDDSPTATTLNTSTFSSRLSIRSKYGDSIKTTPSSLKISTGVDSERFALGKSDRVVYVIGDLDESPTATTLNTSTPASLKSSTGVDTEKFALGKRNDIIEVIGKLDETATTLNTSTPASLKSSTDVDVEKLALGKRDDIIEVIGKLDESKTGTTLNNSTPATQQSSTDVDAKRSAHGKRDDIKEVIGKLDESQTSMTLNTGTSRPSRSKRGESRKSTSTPASQNGSTAVDGSMIGLGKSDDVNDVLGVSAESPNASAITPTSSCQTRSKQRKSVKSKPASKKSSSKVNQDRKMCQYL